MVIMLKRMPAHLYDYWELYYMTKQKQQLILRMLDENGYTWIQGVGEDNRDLEFEAKKQTKER